MALENDVIDFDPMLSRAFVDRRVVNRGMIVDGGSAEGRARRRDIRFGIEICAL